MVILIAVPDTVLPLYLKHYSGVSTWLKNILSCLLASISGRVYHISIAVPGTFFGRRPIVPEHDLTLAQVRELQNRGTCLDGIARLIGVSRRTFFRKWAVVQTLSPDRETPFSKWASR